MTRKVLAGEGARGGGGRMTCEPSGRGAGLAILLATLVVLTGSAPAHAQRLGRRFRQTPPVPRSAPSAPVRPAPAAAAPGSAPARSPTPPAGQRSGAAGPSQKPQTTAAPARREAAPGAPEPAPEAPASIAAADVAWDGVVPFGAEWRRRHPAAWKAEAGEILLTAGTDGPTRVDRTASVSSADAVPQSVLEPTATEPDLLVFPDRTTREEAVAKTPAVDGTVSVLARDGANDRPLADDSPTGDTVVAGADEQRGAAWLPLGAFAALPDGQADRTTPHVFLELSLHRDGTVRGNYYDALADAVHPVAGRVDRDAGVLSWRVGNGPEFLADAEGLATGRARVTVRKGSTERAWTLIALD